MLFSPDSVQPVSCLTGVHINAVQAAASGQPCRQLAQSNGGALCLCSYLESLLKAHIYIQKSKTERIGMAQATPVELEAHPFPALNNGIEISTRPSKDGKLLFHVQHQHAVLHASWCAPPWPLHACSRMSRTLL